MIVCAGFQGRFALDDAYCAGRIVDLLGGEVTDAAKASAILARSFPTAWDGIMARTYGPPGLEADIEFCAQENTVDVVPRFARMVDGAAEIVALDREHVVVVRRLACGPRRRAAELPAVGAPGRRLACDDQAPDETRSIQSRHSRAWAHSIDGTSCARPASHHPSRPKRFLSQTCQGMHEAYERRLTRS